MKNLAKLTKKKITDKNGISRYVWVKTGQDVKKPKAKKESSLEGSVHKDYADYKKRIESAEKSFIDKLKSDKEFSGLLKEGKFDYQSAHSLFENPDKQFSFSKKFGGQIKELKKLQSEKRDLYYKHLSRYETGIVGSIKEKYSNYEPDYYGLSSSIIDKKEYEELKKPKVEKIGPLKTDEISGSESKLTSFERKLGKHWLDGNVNPAEEFMDNRKVGKKPIGSHSLTFIDEEDEERKISYDLHEDSKGKFIIVSEDGSGGMGGQSGGKLIITKK